MDVILRFRYLDEVRYGNLALSLAFDNNVIYFRVFTGIYSKNLYWRDIVSFSKDVVKAIGLGIPQKRRLTELVIRCLVMGFIQFHNIEHAEDNSIFLSVPWLMEMGIEPMCDRMVVVLQVLKQHIHLPPFVITIMQQFWVVCCPRCKPVFRL